MSDFQRVIARYMGVSTKTVVRWCAKGMIPFARRSKGGHWWMDRRIKFDFGSPVGAGSLLREAIYICTLPEAEREKWFEERERNLCRFYGGGSVFPEGEKFNWDSWDLEEEFSFQARLARLSATTALDREELARFLAALVPRADAFCDVTCDAADAEIERKQYPRVDAALSQLDSCLWDLPFSKFILPEAREAVRDDRTQTRLFVAALALMNRGETITATALAREMKIVRATFYRTYPAAVRDAVMMLGCRQAGADEKGVEAFKVRDWSIEPDEVAAD